MWIRVTKVLCCISVVSLLAGCVRPDPEGRLQNFQEQNKDVEGGGAVQDPSSTLQGKKANIAGNHLVFLIAKLGAGLNFRFSAKVVMPNPEQFDLTLQPVAVPAKGGAPVGEPFEVKAVKVEADGTFTAELKGLNVPGEASTLGRPILTDAQLKGKILSKDSFCGSVDLKVTKPLGGQPVSGTFNAVRIKDLAEVGEKEFAGVCPTE